MSLGRVAIVGAGPGDPELITVKGQRLLAECDAVVHDRLVAPEVVALARHAERYDVGKEAGRHCVPQEEIDALLVRLAGEGKRVVRLKGGDPTVFSRTASELDALVDAGIPFEIVPGVTSAIAGPAYAGIPVTDRRLAGAVAFVTAVRHDGADDLDWNALARIPTLVVLMGASRVEEVVARLLAVGAAASTPAAAIERATTSEQRVVLTTLGDLAHDAREARIESPVVFVVGEVAALASRYAWFEPASVGRAVLDLALAG